MTPEEFVRRYWPAAKASEAKTGVPALITMAQAALESGWGAKCAGNAFFGIKASAGWIAAKKPIVLQDTTEVIRGVRVKFRATEHPEVCSFRAYVTPEEAFEDHGEFLRTIKHRNGSLIYGPCFAHPVTDVAGWAQALQDCGYSTDNTTSDGTPTYAQTLLDVVRSVRKRIPA